MGIAHLNALLEQECDASGDFHVRYVFCFDCTAVLAGMLLPVRETQFAGDDVGVQQVRRCTLEFLNEYHGFNPLNDFRQIGAAVSPGVPGRARDIQKDA